MSLSIADLHEIKVIDTDTHVIEPPDLWVSRVARKWKEDVPHIEVNPDTGHTHWRVGKHWLTTVGHYGQAGWSEFPPSRPCEMEDLDPAAWQSPARLARMDEYGLYAQVLYPNLVGFEAPVIMDLGPELSVICIHAYNDFIAEFASEDSRRLIPVAMLPFWDLDASIAEMNRWRDLGHTSVLYANKMEEIGLPPFYDAYWDPILSTAQHLGLSLNFHIGFASFREGVAQHQIAGPDRLWDGPAEVARVAQVVMSLSETVAKTVTSGVCDRFPELKFVSVESGFGYLPYLLESLDWHWKNYGLSRGGKMLPSEYFRRQCYGSFWFEKDTLPLLELYPDNFMFETDFPHITSLSPGMGSAADHPAVHIEKAFAKLPEDIVRKALCTNAANLYNIDLDV